MVVLAAVAAVRCLDDDNVDDNDDGHVDDKHDHDEDVPTGLFCCNMLHAVFDMIVYIDCILYDLGYNISLHTKPYPIVIDVIPHMLISQCLGL